MQTVLRFELSAQRQVLSIGRRQNDTARHPRKWTPQTPARGTLVVYMGSAQELHQPPLASTAAVQKPVGRANCLVGLAFVLAGTHQPLNGWEADALIREYESNVASGGVSPDEADYFILGRGFSTETCELLGESGIAPTELVHMIQTLPTNGEKATKWKNDDDDDEVATYAFPSPKSADMVYFIVRLRHQTDFGQRLYAMTALRRHLEYKACGVLKRTTSRRMYRERVKERIMHEAPLEKPREKTATSARLKQAMKERAGFYVRHQLSFKA